MVEKQPLITILTDTKNRANLISRCIESIQNQTYQNYEHIIADGGDDNTEEVVKSYNDPKIKYIKVCEGGPVAQTKASFSMSSGEDITFLDDDDEYLPEKLEKQLQLIQGLPSEYGFIYGAMSYYDNETKEYLYDHKAEIEGGREILPIAISDAIVCGTPTFMFRRNVFDAIGGTWVANIGNERSDWVLACKALAQGWKVKAMRESFVRIYINHSAVRLSDNSFYHDNACRYIKFHNYFLQEYSDIITKDPSIAILHYRNLMYFYLEVKDIRFAWNMWIKLLKNNFGLINLALFPYYIVKSIFLK